MKSRLEMIADMEKLLYEFEQTLRDMEGDDDLKKPIQDLEAASRSLRQAIEIERLRLRPS
jgi:uncharacterized membrane protein YgaE (UPF0421/DUF939 family)